jgi:NAD(P)-dependent dehydrogenase (short-subunit alcohol dehydrogenase family)
VWGTNAAKNAVALAKLEQLGRKVLTREVDVTDESQVIGGVTEILGTMGRLDTVVSNAGISNSGHALIDVSAGSFDQVIDVNIKGTFFLFREACRHMVARATRGGVGGSLVVISSVSAIRGRPRSTAYSAAKAAVLGMIRSIAVEYGGYGVRANAILPGWIQTDINRQLGERFTSEVLPRMPIGRWGKPADLAGLITYLAADASAFHTGDAFTIDGGYTLT